MKFKDMNGQEIGVGVLLGNTQTTYQLQTIKYDYDEEGTYYLFAQIVGYDSVAMLTPENAEMYYFII